MLRRRELQCGARGLNPAGTTGESQQSAVGRGRGRLRGSNAGTAVSKPRRTAVFEIFGGALIHVGIRRTEAPEGVPTAHKNYFETGYVKLTSNRTCMQIRTKLQLRLAAEFMRTRRWDFCRDAHRDVTDSRVLEFRLVLKGGTLP